ncbi:MAG: hypothetical protein LUG18_11035, partial [Candidatus Azobacteroides sp.]|nr:hypothetical protein [Candidatus Azobacteroides sp.]
MVTIIFYTSPKGWELVKNNPVISLWNKRIWYPEILFFSFRVDLLLITEPHPFPGGKGTPLVRLHENHS